METKIDPEAWVVHLPYYFSHFGSMEEVLGCMSDYIGTDGAFLLRKSLSNKGLTLSLCHRNSVKHISVKFVEGKYCLTGKKFDTFEDLVVHYRNHDVPNRELISEVRLCEPIINHNRNALPPPQHEFPDYIKRIIDEVRNSPEYEAHIYDHVRDPNINFAPELIYQLKSSDKCQCGLYLSEAFLPLDWTVHKVLECDQVQRTPNFFFVSPDGTSSWKLPDHVEKLLEPEQRTFLKKLAQK